MIKRKRSQAEEDLVPKITQSVITNLIQMGILPATQGPSTAAQVPAPAPETTMPATTIPDAVPYTSGTGVPLSTGVDPKLKAKVWGDQYLPLSSLIASKDTGMLSMKQKADGSISFEKKDPEEVNNMDAWHSAFTVFVAIYTERLPQAGPALMKHSATVQNLAKMAGKYAALQYDTAFRKL